eukprot:CAMPEP_0183552210 /NCGR_PEP_ID=MMETSP0371-20130417/70904_1 /TAXON_ID=268820 /ORGANISM="Peridinium aciculiferum, Strain PAER-2" /LENGTH=118 /DNA_ID=CAMNT_0025757113 /DNA_START=81 /DNA_END=433 /DNA_ORIENTATION=+
MTVLHMFSSLLGASVRSQLDALALAYYSEGGQTYSTVSSWPHLKAQFEAEGQGPRAKGDGQFGGNSVTQNWSSLHHSFYFQSMQMAVGSWECLAQPVPYDHLNTFNACYAHQPFASPR